MAAVPRRNWFDCTRTSTARTSSGQLASAGADAPVSSSSGRGRSAASSAAKLAECWTNGWLSSSDAARRSSRSHLHRLGTATACIISARRQLTRTTLVRSPSANAKARWRSSACHASASLNASSGASRTTRQPQAVSSPAQPHGQASKQHRPQRSGASRRSSWPVSMGRASSMWRPLSADSAGARPMQRSGRARLVERDVANDMPAEATAATAATAAARRLAKLTDHSQVGLHPTQFG